jgi:drug/metabolite transporter (DMT)-like permease
MQIRVRHGTTAFFFGVAALQQISLATVIVYFFCFPAFAALFSGLLFKERIPPGELGCVVLALCGVGILFDADLGQGVWGQVMALLAGMFAGLTVALIKRLRADNGPVGLYFYLCICGCAAAA